MEREEPGEGLDPGDAPAGFVGDELGPLVWCLDRRLHHAEVHGVVVGEHHEPIAPMIELVLDVGAARHDDTRLGAGVGRRDEPFLSAQLAAGVDDDPFVAPRRSDAHIEPLVGLVVHPRVVGLLRAEPVAPHLERSLRRVGPDVEQVSAVGRPGGTGPRDRVGDLVVEIGARLEVADAQPVVLVPRDVGRPCGERVSRVRLEPAELEEVVPGSLDVLVEHEIVRRRFGGPPAAMNGVRLALLGAGDVPPSVVQDGRRQVGLLDARLDLIEDRVDQRLPLGEPVSGAAVLVLEEGDRVGIVLVAEPRERIVDIAGRAVPRVRNLLHGRRRHREQGRR